MLPSVHQLTIDAIISEMMTTGLVHTTSLNISFHEDQYRVTVMKSGDWIKGYGKTPVEAFNHAWKQVIE